MRMLNLRRLTARKTILVPLSASRNAVRSMSTFGYECSAYTNVSNDKTILERSIRAGCRMVTTRSGQDFIQTYELLFDMSDDDECNIKDITVGHILGSQTQIQHETASTAAQTSTWNLEIDQIRRELKPSGKDIDFITYQLQPLIPTMDAAMIRGVLSTLRSYLSGEENSDSNCMIGVDFSTESLGSPECSAAVMHHFIDTVLQPLVRENIVQVLTVACNPLTYQNSKVLLDWANMQKRTHASALTVVATEVLRCHGNKPGLLSGGFHQYAPPHRMSRAAAGGGKFTGSTGSSGTTASSAKNISNNANRSDAYRRKSGDVQEAAEDFQMAMDRCLHAEKIFLSKLLSPDKEPVVPVTDVCLAHVLANTHSQFHFPEEWKYVLSNQVEPRLEQSLNKLATQSSELKDWTTVYQPMSKYLMASFRNLLQEKSLLLSTEVLEAIRTEAAAAGGMNDESNDGGVFRQEEEEGLIISSLPSTMAVLAAKWSAADYVTTALTQVEEEKWQSFMTKDNDKITDNVPTIYNAIQAIFEDYGV